MEDVVIDNYTNASNLVVMTSRQPESISEISKTVLDISWCNNNYSTERTEADMNFIVDQMIDYYGLAGLDIPRTSNFKARID